MQETDNADEVKRNLQGRYIGPYKAVWSLCEFRVHEEFPAVYHLPIHLSEEQPIYCGEDLSQEEVQHRLDTTQSKLIAWFNDNQDKQDSRQDL